EQPGVTPGFQSSQAPCSRMCRRPLFEEAVPALRGEGDQVDAALLGKPAAAQVARMMLAHVNERCTGACSAPSVLDPDTCRSRYSGDVFRQEHRRYSGSYRGISSGIA